MRLVFALLVSLLIYGGLQVAVLHKPLTIGYIRDAFDYKLAYANSLSPDEPRIMVIGGSSTLYSVRCQVIAADTGVPCVNMGVTAGLGIDLILAKIEPMIRPHDILLMPLEYDFYWATLEGLRANDFGNAYVLGYDRALFHTFDWRRKVMSVSSLSLKDAYGSIVEMGLARAGIHRRFSLSQLTPQGDMSGHVPAQAAQYASFVSGLSGAEPMPGDKTEDYGWQLVEAFIARQQAKGVRVIGTFPATLDQGPVDPHGYETVRKLWRQVNADFLDLPNLGRYPATALFDTHYHLNETAQIAHSHLLAQELRRHGVAISRGR